MRAVIFANGVLSVPVAAPLPGDLVFAADGGARHCLALGIIPAVVVGDFDSLEPAELAVLERNGAEVVRHPARKDFTDLELAIQLAVERGMQEIQVLGALGARWDQTLANLLLPAAVALQGVRISLVDGPQEILLIRAGETLEIRGRPGDIVSLIPLNEDAAGISTAGLEYPLAGEPLYFGRTRGISNVLSAESGRVSLESGLLLCVVIHMGQAPGGFV